MTNRKSNDVCLLCQVNKADKKGSHFTPAGIIKKVVGERDKEEIYSIHASQHSISRFMGRSNLKNEDPVIKQGEHVADYIFCTSCEKKLGVIEGLCNEKLNMLVEDLAGGNLKIYRTKQSNKYVPLVGVDKNVLLLYLYSVIWRQCLRQQLGSGIFIISPTDEERLRQIVLTGINMSLPEIKADASYTTYPGLQLLTSYHKGNNITNMFNPNATRTNPNLFYMGPYDVLLYLQPAVSTLFNEQTGLPARLIDSELIINVTNNMPIGIMNETVWMDKIKHLMQQQANIHNARIYRELSQAKGITYELAKHLINQEAATFASQYPDDFSRCMNLALDKLLTS